MSQLNSMAIPMEGKCKCGKGTGNDLSDGNTSCHDK